MTDTKGNEIGSAISAADGLPDSLNEDGIDTTNPENSVVKAPRWRRLLGFFWDSLDGDPRDRQYVQKLDTYLL